jgi:hypothetical protein
VDWRLGRHIPRIVYSSQVRSHQPDRLFSSRDKILVPCPVIDSQFELRGSRVEPSDWIAAVEQDLHGLIESLLSAELGPDWIQASGLSAATLEQLAERRDEEAKRRQGGTVDSNLLRYSNFYDLKILINKHWARFQPVLGDKKSFDVYFGRIEDFRNAPAHSRELLPFERDLLAGTAGEIRNRITISRSTMGPDKEFYPRIESVLDNFGQEFLPGRNDVGFMSPLSLTVGQELEFRCRGWDPNGREMIWALANASILGIIIDEAKGIQVSLRMIATEEFVGDRFEPTITLSSSGQYHRFAGRYDDSARFYYRVLPPED